MTKLQSKMDLTSSLEVKHRHNYIVNYFSKKVPEDAKGRLYHKVMDYIQNNPQIVPEFDDSNFFRWFHRSLIKTSYLDIENENQLPHYCYGRAFNLEDMCILDSFELEKQREENYISQGIDFEDNSSPYSFL